MEPSLFIGLILMLLACHCRTTVTDTAVSEQLIECTGKLATLTYYDCQTIEDWRPGCFYVQHFSQYRPCNSICDGVAVGSMEEERCQVYCEEYYQLACRVKQPLQQFFTTVTATPNTPHVMLKTTKKTAYHSISLEFIMLLTGALVLMLLLVTLGIVVVIFCGGFNKTFRRNTRKAKSSIKWPIEEENQLQDAELGHLEQSQEANDDEDGAKKAFDRFLVSCESRGENADTEEQKGVNFDKDQDPSDELAAQVENDLNNKIDNGSTVSGIRQYPASHMG